MSVVVTVGVLSAALLTAAPAPTTSTTAPTTSTTATTTATTTPLVTDSRDLFVPIAAGAIVVGGALATGGTVVAVGHQSVIADAAGDGDDRLHAQQQLPVAVGVAVVGGVVLVAGVAVAVWRALVTDSDTAEAAR
ncbi:MAG TPA: hypothetical protein VGF99_10885 [Myxococcota bacterium]